MHRKKKRIHTKFTLTFPKENLRSKDCATTKAVIFNLIQCGKTYLV